MPELTSELTTEDAKLVTLARSVRARTNATQGAAVRDLDGRTYAGAAVSLPSMNLGALEVCVSMAISSGARGLEAAVLLVDDSEAGIDLAALTDFAGAGVPVHVGGPRGSIERRHVTEAG